MSLFPNDEAARLPLLTQLVQLEIPTHPDATPEELGRSELGTWLRRVEGHLWQVRREGPQWEAHLRLWQRLYCLARLILPAVADRGAVPSGALAELEALSNQKVRVTIGANAGVPDCFTPVGQLAADESVPVEKILVLQGGGNRLDHTPAGVLLDLENALGGRLKVIRCAECDNPFVATPMGAKRGQFFCSSLHADRAGQKRRRRESRQTSSHMIRCR